MEENGRFILIIPVTPYLSLYKVIHGITVVKILGKNIIHSYLSIKKIRSGDRQILKT